MKVVKPSVFPKGSYHTILALMPIATVDFVIAHRGSFLLGRRKNRPAKGQWWVPGGRVWKGETQAAAIKRKLKQETGLSARSAKFVDVYDCMFSDSAFNTPAHCISLLYVIKPVSISKLRADWQHSELKWFKKINPKWHPVLKQQLRDAGFK